MRKYMFLPQQFTNWGDTPSTRFALCSKINYVHKISSIKLHNNPVHQVVYMLCFLKEWTICHHFPFFKWNSSLIMKPNITSRSKSDSNIDEAQHQMPASTWFIPLYLWAMLGAVAVACRGIRDTLRCPRSMAECEVTGWKVWKGTVTYHLKARGRGLTQIVQKKSPQMKCPRGNLYYIYVLRFFSEFYNSLKNV